MAKISHRPLPDHASLTAHIGKGDYADCLTVDVPGEVSLAQFVTAFYTSKAFRPERAALGLFLGRGADDGDVAALANGDVTKFAAWNVEGRDDTQLLMRDFLGRTRSWLMVDTLAGFSSVEGKTTRLYFGTWVGKASGSGLKAVFERVTFRILHPFHKTYARVLLKAAARGLGYPIPFTHKIRAPK